MLITLAAACFVAAFAIAALAPPELSLGDGLQRLVGPLSWPEAGRTGPAWQRIWHGLVLPFLLRPAWLPPLMLGFVSAGIAVSLGRPSPGGAKR